MICPILTAVFVGVLWVGGHAIEQESGYIDESYAQGRMVKGMAAGFAYGAIAATLYWTAT